MVLPCAIDHSAR